MRVVKVQSNWQVYIVRCTDGSLYTGITTDIERRLSQHRSGAGAKYFRGHNISQLVYLEPGHDRSSASRREAEIKKLPTAKKRALVSASPNLIRNTTLATDQQPSQHFNAKEKKNED